MFLFWLSVIGYLSSSSPLKIPPNSCNLNCIDNTKLPTGFTLDNFFSSLDKVKQSTVRISYIADSVTDNDTITGYLRYFLQKKFGNAGIGWLPPGKYRKWGKNWQIKISDTGWKFRSILGPTTKLRKYGYGGVLSWVFGKGARTTYTLKRPHKNIILTVNFLTNKYGGRVNISVNGHTITHFIPRKGKAGYGKFIVNLKKKVRTIGLYTEGTGYTNLTGIDLRYDVPGIIVDNLGIIGSRFIHHILKNQNHWHQSLKRYSPTLLIFHFGLNDPKYTYNQKLSKKIIRFIQNSVSPLSSCIVMGVTDRVTRVKGNWTTTKLTHKRIAFYHNIAKKSGCAFFNTWKSMGGNRSAIDWYRSTPKLMYGDLEHLTPNGGKIIAKLLFKNIIRQYILYKKRIILQNLKKFRMHDNQFMLSLKRPFKLGFFYSDKF